MHIQNSLCLYLLEIAPFFFLTNHLVVLSVWWLFEVVNAKPWSCIEMNGLFSESHFISTFFGSWWLDMVNRCVFVLIITCLGNNSCDSASYYENNLALTMYWYPQWESCKRKHAVCFYLRPSSASLLLFSPCLLDTIPQYADITVCVPLHNVRHGLLESFAMMFHCRSSGCGATDVQCFCHEKKDKGWILS